MFAAYLTIQVISQRFSTRLEPLLMAAAVDRR